MAVILAADQEIERAIDSAVRMLRDGLVVAFPTDTLYGLAVDPRNRAAVRRLYDLKGRAETSALTVIAANVEQADAAAELGRLARILAARWWPGPLTVVAAARPSIVSEALAGGGTVGVRVPDHPIARALPLALGFCVTATSANRSGSAAATDAAGVLTSLPDVDAVIDGGAARGGPPSTIVDTSTDELRLVRAGAIAWDRVLKSLG